MPRSCTVRVLGLESSCDDTAAAVVEGAFGPLGAIPPGNIRSQIGYGQDRLHQAYGGVVPEIAARAHTERADHAIEAALSEAGVCLQELDAVAVTAGPGLAPALLAGVMTARGVAEGAGLPLHSVNHLEAHALTVRLVDRVSFPYLLLLASGGHCLFAAVESPLRYRVYGSTLDDAPGEAYDKVARLLGFSFPGGPCVERAARLGKENRFNFPRPLAGRAGCSLSFSGLKTAVARKHNELNSAGEEPNETDLRDMAASFQAAVRDVLVERATAAMRTFCANYPSIAVPAFAGTGGVLANQALRHALSETAAENGFRPVFPDPELCTDNGAMVAWAGIERIGISAEAAPAPVRARWPLEDMGEE